MAEQQRISYVPLEDMTPEMRAEMERCAREGTPRPESSAVRAHVPAAFWFFANSLERPVPQRRPATTRSRSCAASTSRARSSASTAATSARRRARALGLDRGPVRRAAQLRDAPTRYNERQKAALAYAEAIAWHLDTDDAFWERMHAHFSEPELVELGCMIGLTLGQQSWLRLLNIEHHEVHRRARSASMAPGFETREALEASKAPRLLGAG